MLNECLLNERSMNLTVQVHDHFVLYSDYNPQPSGSEQGGESRPQGRTGRVHFPPLKAVVVHNEPALGQLWGGKVMWCRGLPGSLLCCVFLWRRETSELCHSGNTFLILVLYHSYLCYLGEYLSVNLRSFYISFLIERKR